MADDKDLNDALNSAKNIASEIVKNIKSNFEFDSILEVMNKVDDKASDLINKFGQGRDNIVGLKAALTESVTKVTQLGGSFEKIAEIQQDVSTTLGRNVILQGESYERLYAATKVTGKESGYIVDNFKNAGISAYQSATQIEKVVNISRELGVNAQTVSSEVLRNMDYLNKFNFQGGVEGLAKMAANATGLRINMGQTLAFADKVYNPEGAIQTAAALQRLGVTQSELLDPLRLMDLSQNDPVELQNQITQMTQQFVTLNEKGQFEILPGAKRQLQEIAREMGMNYSEMTKFALGGAELDDKLKKIKFPDFATEDQKKLIANLTEMGEGGEYKIQVGTESLNISDILEKAKDEKGLKELLEAAKPKTIEDIAKEQLSATQSLIVAIKSIADRTGYAVAGGERGGELVDVIRKSTEVLNKMTSQESLSIKNIREGVDKNFGSILDGINDLVKGDKSVSGVFTDFETVLSNSGTFIKDVFLETIGKTNETFNLLNQETENKLIKTLQSLGNYEVSSDDKSVTPVKGSDVLKHPGGQVELLPQDSFFAMTNGDKFIEKVKMMSSVVNNTNDDIINRIKNMSVMPNNSMATNTTSNSNINLNINIDASKVPSHIDTNELKLALGNQSIKEEIVKSLKSVMSNNNLTQSSGGMMIG
jgi:hypothetical protein